MYSARCKKCGLVEREGMGCVWSSIPVAIFKPRPQTHIYLCLYFINNLFNDHAKSYKLFTYNHLWNKKKRQ